MCAKCSIEMKTLFYHTQNQQKYITCPPILSTFFSEKKTCQFLQNLSKYRLLVSIAILLDWNEIYSFTYYMTEIPAKCVWPIWSRP